jgi:hypothetical protein
MKHFSTVLTAGAAAIFIFQNALMPMHIDQFKLAPDRKAPEPPRVQTSAWGQEHTGLRCRATTTTVTEQSMSLDISVEMESIPKSLKPKIKQLNTFLPAEYMECTLVHLRTGKSHTVRPYDPTHGMPARDSGKNAAPLDGSRIKPWEISCPLVVLGDGLEPGQYECRVRFSFPQKQTAWWRRSGGDWDAVGFWHGTVESGPFRLEVMKETLKTHSFLLPKQLRLEKGLKINYTKADAEHVELKLRNGHFVSARYLHYNDKKLIGETMTGVPTPDDVNPITSLPDYKGGNRKVTCTIEIFETADPPVHLWHPGPGSGGYKVLWSRTFTLSFTEKEIRQKQ